MLITTGDMAAGQPQEGKTMEQLLTVMVYSILAIAIAAMAYLTYKIYTSEDGFR